MLRNGAVVVARYLCDGAGDEQGDADSEQRICCAMMGEKSDKDDVVYDPNVARRSRRSCRAAVRGNQFSSRQPIFSRKKGHAIYETRKTHSPAASDVREREICCGLEGCIGKDGESVHRTKTTDELWPA